MNSGLILKTVVFIREKHHFSNQMMIFYLMPRHRFIAIIPLNSDLNKFAFDMGNVMYSSTRHLPQHHSLGCFLFMYFSEAHTRTQSLNPLRYYRLCIMNK